MALVAPQAGTERWRLLPYLCEPPFQTMERDRLILKNLSAPTLRFYRWARPALSFGRTQGIDLAIQESAMQKGFMVVERPTGGGIVEHGLDLCFSLFWGRTDKGLPWKVKDSYLAIHDWIHEALKDLGVRSRMVREKDRESRWCFLSAVCHDLTADGKKIVGGAQWRERGKALHQGSIQCDLPERALSVLEATFQEKFCVLLEPHGD